MLVYGISVSLCTICRFWLLVLWQIRLLVISSSALYVASMKSELLADGRQCCNLKGRFGMDLA